MPDEKKQDKELSLDELEAIAGGYTAENAVGTSTDAGTCPKASMNSCSKSDVVVYGTCAGYGIGHCNHCGYTWLYTLTS